MTTLLNEIKETQDNLIETSYSLRNPIAYYKDDEEQQKYSQADRLTYINLVCKKSTIQE